MKADINLVFHDLTTPAQDVTIRLGEDVGNKLGIGSIIEVRGAKRFFKVTAKSTMIGSKAARRFPKDWHWLRPRLKEFYCMTEIEALKKAWTILEIDEVTPAPKPALTRHHIGSRLYEWDKTIIRSRRTSENTWHCHRRNTLGFAQTLEILEALHGARMKIKELKAREALNPMLGSIPYSFNLDIPVRR